MAWKEVKFGDLVTLKQGFALNSKSNHYLSDEENGIPLLKISDLFNNTETLFVKKEIPKQFLVFEDEIIYSRTGQVGYAFMGKKGVIYNNCFKVIPDEEKINKIFLYKILNTNIIRNYAQTLATGTAQPDLNHDAFKSIKINLPSLETQQKIVNLISNYDDLIENNNKRIKLLEAMAEEIYKEWFVRLRFPNYQNTKIEDGIPQGWEEKRVLDFGKVIIGKTPLTSKEEYYNGDIPFIKTPDFRQGIYIVNTEETLSKTGASSQKNQFITENSICVSCIGTVGEVVLTTKKSQTNQQINSIILKDLNYLEYLYFSLKDLKPLIQAYASTGATMGNLSKGKFEQVKILSPNEDLVTSYSKLIKPMFKEIKTLMLKNQTLKQTRDLLLPRLLSGKLDIEKLDIN